MKYFFEDRRTLEVKEISKDECSHLLKRSYPRSSYPVIDRILNSEIGFRLSTFEGVIDTKTDSGLVPMTGFYGICE